MKNKSRLVTALSALALMAGFAGTAQAVPMSWSDKYDPSSDILVNGDRPLAFEHNLMLDQGGAYSGSYGFNPATDTITWAEITIRLTDDAWDWSESVKFVWEDGAFVNGPYNCCGAFDGASGYTWGFGALSLAFLQDGRWGVSVQATTGDFDFEWSELRARGERTEAVPEPGTLALFGLALAGLGFAGRRRGK